MHTYAFLVLTFAVWNESAAVSLVNLPAAWTPTLNRLEQALMTQLSLAVPVMAWALATFRFPPRSNLKTPPVAGQGLEEAG